MAVFVLQGETLGCILDMTSNQISYMVNGESMGIAFEIPAPMRGQPLYPAVALKGAQVSVAFGGGNLRHGPPAGLVGIADAPSNQLSSGLFHTFHVEHCVHCLLNMRPNMWGAYLEE